ncbi:MAG: hypothetical protein Q9187_007378 [Circinaria calcarea]
MKPSFEVVADLHKVHSTSSVISTTASYHSALSHTYELDWKGNATTEQNGQKRQSRIDSATKKFSIVQTDLQAGLSATEGGLFQAAALPQIITDGEQHSNPTKLTERKFSPIAASQSDGTSNFIPPAFSKPTRPSTISSRRSSTTQRPTATPRSSRPPSRRSVSERTKQAQMTSRTTPSRSSSTAYNRDYRDSPYVVHRRGKELFDSLEGTLAAFQTVSTEYQDPLLTSSLSALPNLSKCSTLEVRGASPGCESLEKEEGIAIYTPATIIDWTSPSTRRREYDEIDRSCQGIRGLWRRLAPRWCRRNSRLSFYNSDNDSDAGSVRRYRVDIQKIPDQKNHTDADVRVKEKEVRPGLNRSKTSWTCFPAKGRKWRGAMS